MEVLSCRVCLAMDSKLLSLSDNDVLSIFEDVVGVTLNQSNALPQQICELCRARILRFADFKRWCQSTQALLDAKLAEVSSIPIGFMQEINKTFPRNNLAITKVLQVNINDVTDRRHQDFEDISSFKVLIGSRDGNTARGDKDLEEEMLPIRKNEDVIESDICKIETEDSSYEQYEALDEDLIDNYGVDEDRTTIKKNNLDSCSINKIENQQQNPNTVKVKNEKSVALKHFVEIDCGKILIEGYTSQSPKRNIRKEKSNKSAVIYKSTEEASNKAVKRKYKKRTEIPKCPKWTPVRRKYIEWLEALKATSEENLKKYDMKLNKVLTKEEQISKMLARKETDMYKTALFKCEACCKGFMSESAFRTHSLAHQPSSKRPVECALCHVYLGARSMKAHERQHRLELVCLRCGEFVDPSKVKTHFEFHQGVKFECKECCKVFFHNSTFRNHGRIHHADAACALCGELFNGRNGVVVHTRKSHAEDAKEQCEDCQNYFYTKEALQRHLDNCGSTNSPCGWCGVSFPTPNELAAHIPKEHATKTAGTEAYDCTETPKPKVAKTKKAAPKIHPTICDQCGITVYSNYLHLHMLRHTGEKPHECPVCQKSFRIKQSLGIHMMIHRGEKPFKCSECSTSFRQNSHLTRHMRVHTGEKPFTCEVCQKAFSLKVNKEEHVRAVHEGAAPRRRKRGGKGTGGGKCTEGR